MDKQEYLSQAQYLERWIKNKQDRLEQLKELSTQTGSALSGMPGNPNRDHSRVEDAVTKITELEAEIAADVDRLVRMKKEIADAISDVEPIQYQILLELRYLNRYKWKDVADELGCGLRNVYFMHNKALSLIDVPC